MRTTLFLSSLLLLVFTSCVSTKKYKQADDARLKSQAQSMQLTSDLSTARMEISNLKTRVGVLIKDTTALGKTIRQYDALNTAGMNEQQKLNIMLQHQIAELEEQARTINHLRESIEEQQRRVSSILSSVQEALLGFNSDELTVVQKNGKVYVSMSDKLLFQPGSALVDKRGKEALGKLAEVMNRQTDVDVYIEGHTDSKPINTAQFKDNWDLSVVRATSVVRILTKEHGVSPLQIIPSGRGEFMPVADNATGEGRSKNRRTEIIISPKLDKLIEMIQ